jgi:hypothetical protein
MSRIFEPMGAAQKAAFHRAYLEHLQRHDGDIDPDQRRFLRREALVEELVASPVPLDAGPLVAQSTFDRNNRPGPIDPVLDDASLWALTAAKANLSERHAIEQQLAMSARGQLDREDPQSYIDIQELYHTRILSDALAAIGLKAAFGVPPLGTRILIAVMIHLPRAIANVVILAAELGGVVLFRLLRNKARRLFAHEPRALARIEQLFSQIIADEIGHVLYVRSRLGRARLWLARRLLPIVAALYRHDVPEIDRLFGPTALLDRMRSVDLVELRRIHPDRAATDAMFSVLGIDEVPAEAFAESWT